MAAISALIDDFNDGVVDPTKWPNSFGTYSETGGRARVSCDTGFNAFSSALNWTLAESAVFLRGYPPAAGGATTEAWAQVLIKSSTSGTDLGFELRALTGQLVMFNRTGFFDPDALAITYSATDHAWLRVRETGGTTYWDTSPDATTWTNQRNLVSPAWVGDTNIEFQLIAHRSDGTNDVAEFDNVNVSGTILALGTASAPDTAQALAGAKRLTLTPAVETGAGQAFGRTKRVPLGATAEDGQALVLGRRKAKSLAPTTNTAAALTLTGRKASTLAIAIEVSAAFILAPPEPDVDGAYIVGAPYSTWTGTVGAPHGSDWGVGEPWI